MVNLPRKISAAQISTEKLLLLLQQQFLQAGWPSYRSTNSIKHWRIHITGN